MLNEKLFDVKTGRLGDGLSKGHFITLFAYIAGVIFNSKTPTFHGYMHETGHVIAAYLVGGSGHIINPHLAYVKTPAIFAFIVYASGVGFIFLVYYFLSSKKITGRIPALKAFFTACLFLELKDSYYTAQSDFEQIPLAGVAYTLMWVFLLSLRIKRAVSGNK